MTIGILGGGIAALSLAANLQEECIILESEERVGGLCRSFDFEEIKFDIGPHIIFSKHKEVLDLHNSMTPVTSHKRLNRILLGNSYIKYPFENYLSSLAPEIRDKCLYEFISNPYKNFRIENMSQFFISKFGEGMADEYFIPYNKKIWKFDPTYLDLQMVERIPDPPVQDVIDGAAGKFAEGYVHQSTFSYPESGGFESLIKAWAENA